MTDYLSNLPVELIDKILGNIPSFDILTSLCLVNKRLRLLSLSYSRFQINFSCLKNKKKFDIFFSYLSSISSQIVSISFSNQNDATIPNKIDCFFLQFNITNNIFSNLRSLSLSHVDRNMWESIKNYVKSIVSLASLSVDLAAMYLIEYVQTFIPHLLNDLLFISSSLKYLCLRMIHYNDISNFNLNGEQTSSIEHLVIANIRINLSHIYSIAPALRTLNVIIDSYYVHRNEHVVLLQHVTQLSIESFGHFDFSTVKKVFYQMPKLVHLTIVAYNIHNDMIDGLAWEQILTNIITFKFSFSFHRSTSTQQTIELESFSTPFWLENKRWYVKYDRCTLSEFSLLYSMPYFNDTYPWNCIEGPITTKSTGPQIISLPTINHLIVSSKSPINTEILCQFTKLQQLTVKDTEKSFNILLHDIVPCIDMSKITTFSVDPCRLKLNADVFVKFLSSMSHLRSISAPITCLKLLFIYRWPNINRLRIEHSFPSDDVTEKQLTSDEINAFYHSFNHIEYISFDNDTDLNLVELINNMPTTTFSIVIYQPYNATAATFDGFITRDWLEQNTRLCNFFYSCDDCNTVSVWL